LNIKRWGKFASVCFLKSRVIHISIVKCYNMSEKPQPKKEGKLMIMTGKGNKPCYVFYFLTKTFNNEKGTGWDAHFVVGLWLPVSVFNFFLSFFTISFSQWFGIPPTRVQMHERRL